MIVDVVDNEKNRVVFKTDAIKVEHDILYTVDLEDNCVTFVDCSVRVFDNGSCISYFIVGNYKFPETV